MTWATSTTALGSDSSSMGPALLPKAGSAGALAPVPGALWRDGDVWDGSSIVVVEPQGMRAVGTAAAARGYLWVPVTAPRAAHRGRLALHIEECIESALEQRGAPPPGISASTHLDASLSDQLYRARFVEMRGIAVGIPSLEGIANLGRVLDAEDSAVLRWWLAATTDRPLCVVLSSENRALRVYPSPVPFGTITEGIAPPTPRAPSVETAQSVVAMELSDLPPSVAEVDDEDPISLADGVDLPDLDRALGLSPLLGAVETSLDEAEESEAMAAAADEAPFTAQVVAEEPTSASPAVEAPQLVVEPQRDAPIVEACAERATEAAQVVAAEDIEPTPAEASQDESKTEELVEAAAPIAAAPAPAAPALAAPSAAALAPLPVKTLVSPRLLAQKSASLAPAKLEEPQVQAAEEVQASSLVQDELPAMQLDQEDDAPVVAVEAPKAQPLMMNSLPPLVPRKRSPFMIMAAEAHDEMGEAQVSDAAESAPAESPAPASASLEPVPAERKPLQRSALRPLRPRVAAPMSRTEATAPGEVVETVTAPAENIDAAPAVAEQARPALSTSPPKEPPANDPFDAFARDHWRTWVKELEAARGPKPLAVIERLFVTAYMRLDAALERKIADQSAREVMDGWRDSFEKSYTEAFDALRVRGKRPTMVLDIPDLAQRMGRLHGARRVQLMLVDGLRFDVGMMIQDRLKSRGEATLTERLLLWSALPANTSTQIELIGRGPDGLKDKDMPIETPAVVARGRAAHAPRRIRTGRRELFKLDIVEASLREGEGNVRERLHTIADDVAASITDHFSKQPPRTLVMVFGDHGFRIDAGEDGLPRVSQGGASPEEVLVPAFAWLTGAMH